MTRAAQMLMVSSLLGQVPHEKQAGAIAAGAKVFGLGSKLLSGMTRFGGKALMSPGLINGLRGGATALSGGGRASQAVGSVMGAGARVAETVAPLAGRVGGAMERGAVRLNEFGNSRIQAGNFRQGMASISNMSQTARQAAQAANPQRYSWLLNRPNQALDRYAAKGGLRPALRYGAGLVVPKTWTSGISMGANYALAGDRMNHAGNVEDAANFAAANAVYQMRQDPFVSGMGGVWGPSKMVSDRIALKHPGMANQFNKLTAGGQSYADSQTRRNAWGAVLGSPGRGAANVYNSF